MTNKRIHLPLVSVLIPVFNGAKFLKETLDSIEQSTYKKLEVILVDDGSTLQTKRSIRKLAKAYPNVRFFEFARNRGMTRVLNYGINKARGKYIARLNQDDLMLPKRLEKQVAFLQTHPDHVAVGGASEIFDTSGKIVDTIRFALNDCAIRQTWLMLSPFSDPTVMYRKDAFFKTQKYSQIFWPADDVHMWYQLGQIGKLANLPMVLTRVRWHEDCSSIKFHRLQMQKTWEIHQWAAKHVQSPPLITRLFWHGQHLAGRVFTAQFNWTVYRWLKKVYKTRSLSVAPKTAKQNRDFFNFDRKSLYAQIESGLVEMTMKRSILIK